jgi:hypothetical protein
MIPPGLLAIHGNEQMGILEGRSGSLDVRTGKLLLNKSTKPSGFETYLKVVAVYLKAHR